MFEVPRRHPDQAGVSDARAPSDVKKPQLVGALEYPLDRIVVDDRSRAEPVNADASNTQLLQHWETRRRGLRDSAR